MAKVMNIKILYKDQIVEKKILEMLSQIPEILDTKIDDVGMTNAEIDKALEKQSYEHEDAFRSYVLYSHYSDKYWSDEKGWVDIQEASRYTSTETTKVDKPFKDDPAAFFIVLQE